MEPPGRRQGWSASGRGSLGCILALGGLGALGAFAALVLAFFGLAAVPALLLSSAQPTPSEETSQAAEGNNVVNHPGQMVAGGPVNIGQPDPSTLGPGVSFSGAAAIDHDGDPHAYAPPGSGLPTTDYLANAGHPGNWWGIQTDNGRPDGNPVVGPDGYYISTTSGTLSQGSDGVYYQSGSGSYINAATTNYIALPNGYGGAHLGDYVLVTNNSTGQSTWAVYGDNRGTNMNGVEMSAATADAVGVGYSMAGTTSNAGNITVTVYPGSRHKPPGG